MSGGIRLRPYIHIYDVHRNNSVIRIWFNDRFCIHGDEKKINIICSMHCDYNNPYLPTNAHNLCKIIHNLHTSVIESFILVGTCYMLRSFHFTSIYTKCTALIFNSVACLFFLTICFFFFVTLCTIKQLSCIRHIISLHECKIHPSVHSTNLT